MRTSAILLTAILLMGCSSMRGEFCLVEIDIRSPARVVADAEEVRARNGKDAAKISFSAGASGLGNDGDKYGKALETLRGTWKFMKFNFGASGKMEGREKE